MLRTTIVIIIFLFALLIPVTAVSQTKEDFDLQKMEESDTEVKEISPKIKQWHLNGWGSFKDSTILDTLQDYFHIYHPVFKDALTATFVGNYGTPGINNDFFKRNQKTPFFFAGSREAYILTPEELKYFNTTTPYSRMDFSQSEHKSKNNETRFNVIHSQNVNPWLNFTFRIDLAKSAGQYTAQEAKNNSATLYTSYDKDNFAIHSGFISNSVKNMENGGLVHDSLLLDNKNPEYWDVNMNQSRSVFSSTYFFTNAEYRLGKFEEPVDESESSVFNPFVSIIYSFNYERHKQEFIDEEDTTNNFFTNTYYGHDYINDSIRFNRLTNVVQLKQYENANRKFSFGKRAFIGHEFTNSSMPGMASSDKFREEIKYSNIYVGGGIFRETGKFWTWNFDGKFYLVGRNIGQTELNGIISKPFKFLGDSLASVTFTGNISNIKADHFQELFYSNHYRWDNDFSMEQRMVAGGEINLPKRKFSVGANYAIINNYIYNDILGIPAQAGEELLVLSAYFDKDFNYRNLHLRTRLLWQKASNEEYIHLPEFSAFISGYFQFTVSKVLLAQLGFDTRYNTKYYADAYAPSTGLFYLQNEKMYGNYPYIDVYASLRLKRTRAFFKLVNIGTKFLDGEYITTPNYPMNQATFRFGLSWAFYD
ncbi:MAG: putative porin [Bacteroidota bacterium]